MIIRVNDLKQWKACRAKNYYSQQLRLAPLTGTSSANLLFGVALHEMLQFLYEERMNGKPDPSAEELLTHYQTFVNGHSSKVVLEEDAETWQNIITYFAHNYPAYSASRDNWNILALETNTVCDIPGTDLKFAMRADLLVQDKETEGIYLVDHKGYNAMPELDSLHADEQFTAYCWILEQVGVHVSGVICNVLVKRVPDEPALLASGKALSQNKQQATTYDLYVRALARYGFDVSPYEEFLRMLQEREVRSHPTFQQITIRKTKDQLRQYEKELIPAAEDFRSQRMYRNPGWHCKWCDYRSVCQAERDQIDVESVIESDYRQKLDFER